MSAAKKGMKKSTYLIIWTLVIALLCSAVGVVNYEALYWDSALTLYFGEVGVKNVSTVTFDTDDHAQVANLIVAEGAVLLKNEKSALPMKGGKISLFGIDNKNGVLQKVLEDEGFTVNPTLAAFYAASSHSSGAGSLSAGNGSETGGWVIDEGPQNEYTADVKASYKDYNDAAVVVLMRTGAEGNDLPYDMSRYGGSADENYLELNKDEKELLAEVHKSFDKVVVLISSANAMQMDFVDKAEYGIDALLWYARPAGGIGSIAKILSGAINPSGRLVDTYVHDNLSSAAMQNFGDYRYVNEDGSLSGYSYVNYAEGIYVGYKYYETRYEDTVMGTGNADGAAGASVGNAWAYSNEVVYPFGYGLSYTTFEQTLEGVTFDADSDMYQVSVRVKNTGSVAGKSVVEVYAQTPYGSYEQENQVEKASIQLVGFEKTAMLQPGEEATVTVPVERYFLASYDSKGAAGYILSAGDYYLAVGDDAHDALNNVLAAKGYTAADGMTADGNAAKVYSWNQAELDTTTYKMSRVDDTVEVTNQFDHADLNNYGIEMTYLSRSDWQNTYPVERMALAMNDALLEDLNLDWYEKPADAPEVSDFTQGADNGLTFSDMRLIPWEDEDTWNKFIDQLTVDEMASLLMDSRGSNPIESIAMPAAGRTDDNSGFGPLISEGTNGIKWVTEPITARTWNKELFESRGRVMGIEATFCGLTEIWYGGGNIHRTPVGGRNWQYYSEDGNFGYIIGIYEAKGMQAQGVIYCPKHFVLNDQETFREGISTFANEQSIREIYMRAFEGALCEGGAMGVMTSFNRLGTRFSSANYNLVHNVLKGEWAFKGHTTTDGYTQSGFKMHFEEEAAAGIDYTCASNSDYGDAVKSYIEAGDGYMLECLRNITKHNLYALSRTFIQNGLSSNTAIVTIVPWWETTLLAVTAVSAVVLMICVILMAVWNHEKKQPKKKEA